MNLTCSPHAGLVLTHSDGLLRAGESCVGWLAETLANSCHEALGLFLVVHLLLVDRKAFEETWRKDDLDDSSPDEGERSNTKADSLLIVLERSSSQWTASILDHSPLYGKAEDCEADKPSVVAEVWEYIEFAIAKLTSIDLIEKLHKYEGLEHHSVKFAFFGSLEEHCLISCRVSWVLFDKLVDLILVVVEWVTCGKFESE